MRRLTTLLSFIPALLALTASAEISVTAVFKPARIAMGDKAQYLVEIKETSTSQQPEVERITSLPIPQSGGLQLSNGRTSSGRQTSIINGSAEYSVTQQLIIDAKPPRVGRFTIPSYTFQYKGETLRAPAATLQVVERPEDAGPTTDELIFIKVDTPKQLYVGQSTAIQLKLYISEDVRLTGLNSFDRSADGFTMSELPDNQESSEVCKNRRYRVLTWPLTLTPIQTGEQDLSFQFTVSAQIPGQNNRRDPFGGSRFGGSLFDDFFGRSERFNVYNEPTQIEVLPLPTASQPKSFTGAIGDFAMEVYTDRTDTQVGEPIMLSVEIAGSGNFDRINGPIIPESKAWRSYDPESNFQPRTADNSLRGTKRFDYVMIPNTAGDLDIPEIQFAYFDPATKRYTELSSPPITIKVSPSDKPQVISGPITQAPAFATEATPLQKELSLEEALLTLDYRPKQTKQSSKPLQNPKFWMTNLAAASALLISGLFLRRKRRLRNDPAYASLQTAKQEFRSTIQAARGAKDAENFFQSAQSAIRLALTCRTGKNHRNADIAAITQCLSDRGCPQDLIEQCRTLYQTADALRFSGNHPQSNLSEAKAQLERILKAI